MQAPGRCASVCVCAQVLKCLLVRVHVRMCVFLRVHACLCQPWVQALEQKDQQRRVIYRSKYDQKTSISRWYVWNQPHDLRLHCVGIEP